MLVNLVGNAVKFTESGEVVLRAVVDRARPGQTTLHFTVSDTGIGIASGQLRTILQPFTQADDSSTRNYGGTGLGLAISKHLVELMGGHIWPESALGKGTTFHFTARFEPGSVPETADVTPDCLQGARAVIAAPEGSAREILVDTLRDWGLDVESYDRVEAAMDARDRARRRHASPPFVIVDAALLDASPGELAQRLAGDEDDAGATVVLSRWRGHPDTRDDAAPELTHLATPHKPSELLQTLLQAATGGAAFETPTARPVTVSGSPEALRVLLVDDDVVGRKLAQRLLERWGHDVVVTEDGASAIERFAEQPFDLVVLDLEMPLLDGYEVAMRPRKQDREVGARAAIIALTAHGGPEVERAGRAAGIDGVLVKPLMAERLDEAIASARAPAAA